MKQAPSHGQSLFVISDHTFLLLPVSKVLAAPFQPSLTVNVPDLFPPCFTPHIKGTDTKSQFQIYCAQGR